MHTYILLINVAIIASAIPLHPLTASNDLTTTFSENGDELSLVSFNDTNSTAHNLYVIKAVVYEIGILTDVDENDTNSNDTLLNERIDLTFFNPDKNGSIIDLGNIPIPVQTNISGHIITGIAPFDLGSISTPELDAGNVTDGILTGLPFANSLQNAISSFSHLNTTNDHPEAENISTNSLSEDSSDDVLSIPPVIQLNSVFEPLPITITNETFFSAQIS